MNPTDPAGQPADGELIAAANRGSEPALTTLYLRHRDWAFQVARRFAPHDEAAHDAVQEAFIYLFAKFPGFELRCNLRTFLYPALKHQALKQAERDRRFKPWAEDETGQEADRPPAGEPAATNSAALAEWVAGLPEEQQEVIRLRFGDDLPLKEIALALNLPEPTVKSRLYAALDKLRRQAGGQAPRDK